MSESERPPSRHTQEAKRFCRVCGEQYFADQMDDSGRCVNCIVLGRTEPGDAERAQPGASAPPAEESRTIPPGTGFGP